MMATGGDAVRDHALDHMLPNQRAKLPPEDLVVVAHVQQLVLLPPADVPFSSMRIPMKMAYGIMRQEKEEFQQLIHALRQMLSM